MERGRGVEPLSSAWKAEALAAIPAPHSQEWCTCTDLNRDDTLIGRASYRWTTGTWGRRRVSNPRPLPYQGSALPTELLRRNNVIMQHELGGRCRTRTCDVQFVGLTF